MIAIERLLPEAAFIHIIRDGRDSSFSLRGMWFAPSRDIAVLAAYWRDSVTRCRRQGRSVQRYLEVRYEDLLRDTPGQLRRVCDFVDLPFEAGMLTFHEKAPALLAEHQGRMAMDGSVIISREQRRAQQWRVTTPPDMSRVGLWRAGFTAEEQREFFKIAGTLLEDLGYAS